MSDFSKVSLGFAEFVSQLLHETYDASLSAQNYQLEKHSELEKALSLSTEKFIESYVSDEEIKEKEHEVFGGELQRGMPLNEEQVTIVEEYIPDYKELKILEGNKITGENMDLLRTIAPDMIVEERKDKLQNMLRTYEGARLVIDSGEIRAKLELSNLTESTSGGSANTRSATTSSRVAAPTEKQVTPTKEQFVQQSAVNQAPSLPVKNVPDPDSNQNIVIVDKKSVIGGKDYQAVIPNLRMVAAPVKATSTSSL